MYSRCGGETTVADDINSSASFGQKSDDAEELPIIVAQRFLNIFRQLHIFSNERREAFNKMLLELPPEVKNIFQTLPGGTPLQEYMEDVEQKSKGIEPTGHHEHKKSSTILQDAIQHQENSVTSGGGAGVAISGDFAKILANSLAQSNAEIIKELQNSRPAAGGTGSVAANGAMKLVADESFTNIISKALAEAIENSEKKRLEDNKIIANSFMELQENLSKLIEQNGQVKFVTDEKGETKALSSMPMKGIVDDLVKAQSEFLKETSKNQKEELASIISTAIKESQKLSTQTLIESLKQMGDGNSPTPITYAASSPKGASMETVEQALKAQGKEFSSIISMALKESQKNSAQTIAETLESMKKDSSVSGGQNNLKVEEIMRMQANLFRDIARAQNQEFSALISAALKESQRQSTEAIIAALSKLQNLPVQTVAVPVPMATSSQPIETVRKEFEPTAIKAESAVSPVIDTPLINKYINDDVLKDDEDDDDEVKEEIVAQEEPQKKKKKKKKKKNKEAAVADTVETATVAEEAAVADDAENVSVSSEQKPASVTKETPKTENVQASQKQSQTDEKEKTADIVSVQSAKSSEVAAESTASQPKPAQSMLERLMTISTAFSTADDIKETEDDDNDWGWGTASEDKYNSYEQPNDTLNNDGFSFDNDGASYYAEDASSAAGSDQDWEWEYEEVPADAEGYGEEGQDWEWEYEEVPADAEGYGEEGQDWEWEYEDVPEDEQGTEQQNVAGYGDQDSGWDYVDADSSDASAYDDGLYADDGSFYTPDSFVQGSEIVLEDLEFVLLGLEDENFRDPYIENSDNIR